VSRLDYDSSYGTSFIFSHVLSLYFFGGVSHGKQPSYASFFYLRTSRLAQNVRKTLMIVAKIIDCTVTKPVQNLL